MLPRFHGAWQFSVSQMVIYFSVFLTGFSGLVYEVVWHRYLENLLGSQAKAGAIILAVFLAGLSLGYWLFGIISRNKTPRYLLMACGVSEVLIGVWAIFFHSIYLIIFKNIGILNPLGRFSEFIDILVAVLLIGVPTILMGCTMPLLTQAMSPKVPETGKVHARIYGLNTLGAFIGALSAGFILLPSDGLPLTIYHMGGINVLAGFLLLMVGAQREQDQKKVVIPQVKGGIVFLLVRAWPQNLAALIAGYLGISLQMFLNRIFGISAGSSEYSFCLITSIYLMMLGLGSTHLANIHAKIRNQLDRVLVINQLKIFGGMLFLYVAVTHLPYFHYVIRHLFTNTQHAFYFYNFSLLCFLLIFLFFPLFPLGQVLPLLVGKMSTTLSTTGFSTGVLYFFNTLGCVLGALLSGYYFLHFMNLSTVLLINLVLGLILMALFLPWRYGTFRQSGIFLGASVLVLIVLTQSKVWNVWKDEYLATGLFRFGPISEMYSGSHVLFHKLSGKNVVIARRDDPNTSVSVTEFPATSENPEMSRSIYVNGKSDGATVGGDLKTTRLLAHIPALLSPSENARVAVIGFGTGVTAGSLSIHPSIERIENIEISSAVREFSKFFEFKNHAVTQSGKFHWISADAYRYLASVNEKYDVIISEPSNPWMMGVERLYSLEFYELVSRKLQSHGIFCQWIHTYSMAPTTLGLVLSTFSEVFKFKELYLTGNDLILIGMKIPIEYSSSRITDRWKIPEVKQELEELGIHTPLHLWAQEIPLLQGSFLNQGLQVLDFPKLSFMAGKDFFLSKNVSIDSMVNKVMPKPAVREVVMKSKLSKEVNSALGKIDFKKKVRPEQVIVSAFCPKGVEDKIHNASGVHEKCRKFLMIKQAYLKKSKTNFFGFQEVFEILSEIVSENENPKNARMLSSIGPPDIEKARQILNVYNEFDSILFPLPRKSLFQALHDCVKIPIVKNSEISKAALQCRTSGIEILLNTGDQGLYVKAKDLFLALKKDASENSLLPKPILEGFEISFIKSDNYLKDVVNKKLDHTLGKSWHDQ